MSNLSTWLGIFPLVAAMLATWLGATYFWLRAAKLRPYAALAAAPAATGGVILPLSYLYYWQGWFWSGARVLPVLGGIGVLGALVFLGQNLRQKRRARKRGLPPQRLALATFSGERLLGRLPATWMWLAAIVLGWGLAIVPTLLAGASNNPVQQWDPSAHLNGVWGMTQRGIAAPGYGLEHNYGGRSDTGYPIGWYAFTSLFSTQYTVIQAANASSLALMAVWVIGVGAFTATIFGGRSATLFATVAAGCMLNMPADNLTAYSQWPNAQAVVFLPGTAVVAILVGRAVLAGLRRHSDSEAAKPPRHSSRGRKDRRIFAAGARRALLPLIPGIIVLIACTVGGIQAHQVMAFNLVVLMLPALLAGAGKVALTALRRRNWLVIALEGIAFVACGEILWLVMNSETLQYMSQYPRNGQSWAVAFSNLLTPTPPFQETFGLIAWMAVVAVLFTTAIVCVILAQRPGTRRWLSIERKTLLWPLFSVLGFMFLVLIVMGPNSDFRSFITAPWYLDYRRLMGPYNLVIAAFMGYGFALCCGWLLRLWETVAIVITNRMRVTVASVLAMAVGLFTLGGALDSRLIAAQSVLDPDNLGKAGMVSQEELDMLRTLDDVLEEGAVVLGDPQNGSTYVQVIGQRWAYFPQLTFTNRSWTNRQLLVYHFNEIHTNPAVCEALVSESVKYYYEDEDGYYYSQLRSDRSSGLYNVDTSTGFELVAEGGTAKVWKITACDYLLEEDEDSEGGDSEDSEDNLENAAD